MAQQAKQGTLQVQTAKTEIVKRHELSLYAGHSWHACTYLAYAGSNASLVAGHTEDAKRVPLVAVLPE